MSQSTSVSPLRAVSEVEARPGSRIRLHSTYLGIESIEGPSFSELTKDQAPGHKPQAPDHVPGPWRSSSLGPSSNDRRLSLLAKGAGIRRAGHWVTGQSHRLRVAPSRGDEIRHAEWHVRIPDAETHGQDVPAHFCTQQAVLLRAAPWRLEPPRAFLFWSTFLH